QNGMNPVKPVDSIAPRSWVPLVAFRGVIVKVVAARTLHDIVAHRSHISDLALSDKQNSLRQQWITMPYQVVIHHGGILNLRRECRCKPRNGISSRSSAR